MMASAPRPVELPTEGFVRERTVLAVFPVGRSTWWRGVKDGIYPKPVRIGQRITVWDVRDIRALIARFQSSAQEAR